MEDPKVPVIQRFAPQPQPMQQSTQQQLPQSSIFNLPVQQPQVQQFPPGQPIQEVYEQPEKKKTWWIWILVILLLMVAAFLGYYFLF